MRALDCINAAADLANDNGLQTWPQASWLRWCGEALAQVVQLVPRAYQVRTPLTLVAGDTVQTLPTTAVRLVRVIRNLGATGTAPGRRVTVINETALDALDPNWHTSLPDNAISHYMVDDEVPRLFMVYPRPAVSMVVDAIVSQVPPAPVDANTVLALPDEYLTPVVNFMMHRAYMKNHQRGDLSKSQMYYSMFERALGIRDATDLKQSPDRKAA